MFKGYIYFTASLVGLVFSEAWLVNSYVKESSFPWDSLIAFLLAIGAVYTSLEQFKKDIRDSKKSEKDAELFKELIEVLPPERTISFFKHTDFHGSVLRSELDGLRQFRAYWDSVDKEFFDKKIDAGRKKMYSAVDTFMAKYSTYTSPVGDGDFASVYTDTIYDGIFPDETVNNLKKKADELNSIADSLAKQYEEFVREGKRKFII
ncbi:MAG: hypothetical protein AB7E96_11995 [Deferribacterales bacterium]